MDQDIEFMKIAYNEALKALKFDEVPIGAIIVRNGEIIARAHNLKETSKQATKHAEIIAIEEAEKKLDNWHLDDCVLYTTLEPCMMCTGAIIQSRIKKVVFGASEKRWSCISSILEKENVNHYPEIVGNIYEKQCSMLISQYFKYKRL
jgi:tRNA(adenine34) deaminase